MSQQVDSALDDLRGAMRQLQAATRGMPVKQGKLRESYARLTEIVGQLLVQVDDARSIFTPPG